VILVTFELTKVFYTLPSYWIDSFGVSSVGQWIEILIDTVVIRALLMAVMQRQSKSSMLIHSDQGSQYGSADYLAFMKAINLEPSMSRREDCHDNAVAERFLATFKKLVTQRKIYST